MTELMLYNERKGFIQKKLLLDRGRYFRTTPSLYNRCYWAERNIISEFPARGSLFVWLKKKFTPPNNACYAGYTRLSKHLALFSVTVSPVYPERF